jgi:hypothetical protein
LEYFNLVAAHGFEYELHDDFYDDSGVAYAAEEPIEQDSSLAFPTIPAIQGNASRLVDYAVVKWRYPAEITAYLQAFDPLVVLHLLDEKLALNSFLLPKCLEIAAQALGTLAQDWVRYQLGHYDGPNRLLFAEAAASCLPTKEAEEFILSALNRLDERTLPQQITCLCYLHGDVPLDWLETRCRTIISVSGNYGFATAALGFTWGRAHRWLLAGRPLSLIALDALVACSTTADTANAALWLREHPPRLLAPASTPAMEEALLQYFAQDSVPRTKNAVQFIKENWARIMKE